MIYYVPEDEDLKNTQKLLEAVSAGARQDDKPTAGKNVTAGQRMLEITLARYRYRIVRTHEEFLEKLAIFDAGLDDRIVELTKVILSAQAERQLSDYGFRVKGVSFIFNNETKEKKLIFLDKNSSQTATASFDQHVANVYNQIIDRYSAELEGPREKDTIIDREWAAVILNKESNERTQ